MSRTTPTQRTATSFRLSVSLVAALEKTTRQANMPLREGVERALAMFLNKSTDPDVLAHVAAYESDAATEASASEVRDAKKAARAREAERIKEIHKQAAALEMENLYAENA